MEKNIEQKIRELIKLLLKSKRLNKLTSSERLDPKKIIQRAVNKINKIAPQIETENYLNPTDISLNTNDVIQQITKYNKYRYRFVLERFLFSSNF